MSPYSSGSIIYHFRTVRRISLYGFWFPSLPSELPTRGVFRYSRNYTPPIDGVCAFRLGTASRSSLCLGSQRHRWYALRVATQVRLYFHCFTSLKKFFSLFTRLP